jgi:hypothetical protein
VARLNTPEEAAAWLERVGIALLFPNLDYVIPSLWEEISGDVEISWAIRAEDGKFESFTPEFDKLWRWKDELPRRRLACVGLHVARTSSLVTPKLVAPLFALTGRSGELADFGDVEGPERAIAEASLELGRPASRRELRLLVGTDKRTADRAINALQKKLLLTNAGRAEDEPGWPSTLHDLFTRRWRARLRRIPERDEALHTLATALLRTASLSVADLAATLRIRRKEAATTLEALEATSVAERGYDDDVVVWQPARARK